MSARELGRLTAVIDMPMREENFLKRSLFRGDRLFDAIQISARIDRSGTSRLLANEYRAILFKGRDRDDEKFHNRRNPSVSRSCRLTGLPCILAQQFVRDDPECVFVSGFEYHRRRYPGSAGLEPTTRTQAPAITRFEPGKPPLRPGRHQVVAAQHGKVEKLAGHPCAYRVTPAILRTRLATTRAREPGERIKGARLKRASQNIERAIDHDLSSTLNELALRASADCEKAIHCRIYEGRETSRFPFRI